MTRRRRDELRQAIDQARRAQLDRMGGFGKVESCARGHERALGLHRPSPSSSWHGRARRMRCDGATCREIMAALDQSYGAVQSALNRHGPRSRASC